ncbi:MAG TPA: hypothetical protein VKY26_04075, partial [Actinomycetota bacterium]|nr:hypothetical protein [Actinomycetota bacterium]
EGRPQRPVPVRVRDEVQALPRRRGLSSTDSRTIPPVVPCAPGIIGPMDDLKPRLRDADAKLAHVKEYL